MFTRLSRPSRYRILKGYRRFPSYWLSTTEYPFGPGHVLPSAAVNVYRMICFRRSVWVTTAGAFSSAAQNTGVSMRKTISNDISKASTFFMGMHNPPGKCSGGREKMKNSEQNVSPGSVDPGETELLYFYRGILSFFRDYSLMTPIRKGLVFTFSKTSLVTVTSTLPSALPTPSKTFHSISPSASSGRIPISTMTFWPSA